MFRPLLACLSLSLAPAALAQTAEEQPQPLSFSGEPIGSEVPIAQGLHVDAAELVLSTPDLGPLDGEAATLQRGLIVRAFAEAHAEQENPDPVVVARSHARRALILARLGAVNFAAEHANAALAESAVRGEVMLARAWMLWHAGNIEAADRDAAQAKGAPAWALAEWRTHRAKFGPALKRFLAAPEPEDRYGPDFLAYAELAAASGAYSLADGIYFSALNNLQMQLNAEPATPPATLQRARRGFRDFLRTVLGNIVREPGTMRLSAVMLSVAREACHSPANRADWEIYLQTAAEIQQHQSRFEFGYYDLHEDLARAEKEVGTVTAWRERLQPLLANPRQRFASRLQRTFVRLEAHPGLRLLDEPLDSTLTSEQQASLRSLGELTEAEDAVLSNLHQALPADPGFIPNDREYVVLAARIRFRLALLAGDVNATRLQVGKLEQFSQDLELAPYHAALAKLERGPFLEAYTRLLRYSPSAIPEAPLEAALLAADEMDDLLSERHGDAYLLAQDLPPETAALVQQLCHIRVLVALNTGAVLAAERALADLELWCDPKKHPPFAPLPALISAVTEAPAQSEKFNTEELAIWNSLKSGVGDTAFPGRIKAAIEADSLRWNPRLLEPIAHWRLGQDDLARAAIARTKELIRYNRASRTMLDTLVANNDPTAIVQRLVNELAKVPAEEKAAKAAAVRKELNMLLRNLAVFFCGGQDLELKKLPPNAARVYAFCLAGHVRAHLADNRLGEAIDALNALEAMNEAEALALARPAVEGFAFTNDLPDEAARAAWRRLLDNSVLSEDALNATLTSLKDASDAGSLSAGMVSVLVPYRTGNIRQARSNLAMLQRHYGRVRAVAAQLDQLNELLVFGTDDIGLDFGNANERQIEQLLERRRELEREAREFRDANHDRLAESYAYDRYSIERGMLEKILRQIDDLSAQIKAVADRERAEQDRTRRRHENVRQEAYANLRRLMQL